MTNEPAPPQIELTRRRVLALSAITLPARALLKPDKYNAANPKPTPSTQPSPAQPAPHVYFC